MTRSLRTISLAAAFLGGVVSSRPAAQPSRPNILFILANDLDLAEVAYMPKVKSLLADQGVTFTNYFVSVSLCCPSRTTMLRGQYSHNTGVKTNGGGNGGFETAYAEGVEKSTNKSAAATKALMDYANAGGRVFASHWHNWWFEKGPDPMPTVATFNHRSDPASPLTATIDTTFPKGEALADWLVNVGGSTTKGQLSINAAKRTVQSVNMPAAQRWIYNTAQASVQYFTANTPVGAPVEMLCGRAVFSDIHVTAADNFVPGPFPTECGAVADLSPQEKALEFMLFDLSSCIQDDTKPPQIP